MPAQHPQSGSEETASAAPIWRFADFELDAEQRQLRRRGEPVALEPKPFDFLCLLVGQAGSLVTKDQLIEEIWAGRVVTESVITRCAAKVRKALGETTAEQLVTVHGYGYRFEAEVQRAVPAAVSEAPASAPRDASPVGARLGWRWVAAACGLLVVAGSALLGGGAGPQAARYEHPSIAVLPFANLSPDKETSDYLAGGVHENLLTQLSKVEGLKVISRTSVTRYEDTTESIPVIGQRLGVDFVLEGSIQLIGKRLRVNAQLIEVATDHHHWADALDGDVADVLEIQSRVAEHVAKTVGLQLVASNGNAGVDVSAAAMEAYLRARQQFREDPFGRESLFRSQAALDRALVEGQGFAQAYALRSRMHTYNYWFAYDYSDFRLEQARQDWHRAQTLDPALAEGYLAQGQYLAAGFRDYSGALAAYEKAAALEPGNGEILQLMASAYRRMGQVESYIELMVSALRSDPENVSLLSDLAGMRQLMRQYGEARMLYRRALSLKPDDVMLEVQLAMMEYGATGDPEPLQRVLDAQAGNSGPGHYFDYFRFQAAYWQRDFSRALDILQGYARHLSPTSAGGPEITSVKGQLGRLHLRVGAREQGLALLQQQVREIHAQLERDPNNPSLAAYLAFAYASLEDIAGSETHGRRALDLAASAGDPVQSADVSMIVIAAWARLPDLTPALDLLEASMLDTIPPAPGMLAAHPFFDPLRAEPRFQQIVNSADAHR